MSWSRRWRRSRATSSCTRPAIRAFFNSQLDSALRARGIRNIVFVGIATNVCVESTLRDGFHLEYFGVMLEDATHHLGPGFDAAGDASTMSRNSSAGSPPSPISAARSARFASDQE